MNPHKELGSWTEAQLTVWSESNDNLNLARSRVHADVVYPSLRGAPRPPSLPSISADDSSSKLGSSICQCTKKRWDFTSTGSLLRPLFTIDVCCVQVTPHQRTVESDEGCALAPSVPESSSSVLPGWCWSPSVHSPTFQRWPADQSQGSVEKPSNKRFKDETSCFGHWQLFNQRWRAANRKNRMEHCTLTSEQRGWQLNNQQKW